MSFAFSLEEKVTDTITRFKGTIIQRLEALGEGCSYCVQPSLSSTGDYRGCVWFHEDRLTYDFESLPSVQEKEAVSEDLVKED